ncbi:DUF2268 domain-containing putative Zn-dependent protease [Paracoccus sp. (in: a-proteobacteria)]|uniref:DUF2268 domain-containing putative Zn-dependent protease n=1 Tax=Paracoccus sp. TaxID=267 RepID=UPI0026DEEB97|nr:DUF2268 domain-containing putative Zn-dependent protease [Paracoccus sp. (in: a-proteobacteria)]MDO5368880.1 DUF2268 domain-containing putative Zn-dependent protease [Paracoccus sp. (in: a-proteobacteria)]
MPYWQVHFLNARHALTGIMPEVRAAVAESVALAAGHLGLPDFDLVVQAGDGGSDWGVLGAARAPGVIELTLSPARFAPDLLIRRMVRELHHLVRWEHPGYGRSLGEALVSEGLAGHFVARVLGGPPDPWDVTTPPSGLAKRAMTEWAWREFDRGLWFEGRGNIRKWAGYGLAHRLLAEHLAREPDLDPLDLIHAPAETLRPAMRRLSGAPEPDEAPEPAGDASDRETDPLPGPAGEAQEMGDAPPAQAEGSSADTGGESPA